MGKWIKHIKRKEKIKIQGPEKPTILKEGNFGGLILWFQTTKQVSLIKNGIVLA